MKSFLFLLFSKIIVWRERSKMIHFQKTQHNVLQKLIKISRSSQFGKDHHFHEIKNYENVKSLIPLRNYEDFKPYIELIKNGQQNVLQQGAPLYLVVSSGTTSGAKFIPISKASIRCQINAALKLLCFHAVSIKQADFMNFKMLFLQGSPALSHEYPIPSARLSGVVYHHVPLYFNRNKLPSYAINIETDWQKKVEKIAAECLLNDISVFGGIPPWCIQLFDQLLSITNASNLKEIFPALSIYIYGGVDFSPYESKLKKMLGDGVSFLETYPASEGFFAISDNRNQKGMLLLVDQGIFYEFISVDQMNEEVPETLLLHQVEKGRKYEMVISTNAGLWRYRIGDIVEFVSVDPFRVRVVGRTSQFISAFGEHVIASEIDDTISNIIDTYHITIEDFHVSPNVEARCYEWRIEGEVNIDSIATLEKHIDELLSSMNKYYKDLIVGKVLNQSRVILLKSGTFNQYRIKYNKLGEQNKVQRLSNESSLAAILDELNNN
jgi:hypothetical protein